MELHPIRQDEPHSTNRDILAICEGTKHLYKYVGFNPPWIGYLAKVGSEVVGTCAFKSSPREGRVEIAYLTFPQFEGKGFATQMVHRLVETARLADPTITVYAQTEPARSPSNRVLQKLGFRSLGTIMHPEDGAVWEWEQPAPATASLASSRRESIAN